MKNAYYFPHDTNAIQDPKLMRLLIECGVAGIGLYWILIEILHQQEWVPNGGPMGGLRVSDMRHYIDFYGKQGAWDQIILDKFEKVVLETKLLILEGDTIYSERVRNNHIRRIESSEEGKKNAFKRWGTHRPPNGVPLATQCDPNAINEIKRNKKKERRQFEKPTASQVTDYAKSIDFDLDGSKFVNHYEASGWIRGKTPIKDWKACVRYWKSSSNPAPATKKEVYL